MIKVEGLTKRFRGSWAVSGISFEVARGEIFGFVGPNGAGKTTTMRVLAGLLRPTSGSAWLDGIDVIADPMAVRERIGFMPDFFGVYDQFTTDEYLSFYASCYGIPRARIKVVVTDLLDLINLADKRHQPVDSLSRGMKQRLCLARTLVHDPPVLILDEPASGLDPRARHEMRELLVELREMGKTILISSHILPELAELCTSFGILSGGRMVTSGSMGELVGEMGRRRARVRINGDPEAWLAPIRQQAGVAGVDAGAGWLEIEYEGADDEASALLAGMIRAGIPVLSFTPVETDLEQVFLRLTTATGETA